MKTSKILSAVLVGTLLFGLTACGGDNPKKDDTKESKTEIEETVDETTVEETEDEAKDSPETDDHMPTSHSDEDVTPDHHGGESNIPDEHHPTNPDAHNDEQGGEAKDTTPDTEVDSHYFDEDGRVKDN